MDVECMWPGSVHDAKVLANSSLNQILNNLIPNTLHFPRQNVNEIIRNYIIGDPACPLLPYCIKEYESCSNDAEIIFNSMLRSARNQIERTFGRLKTRLAILSRKIDLKLENVPNLIYACFVLHNFCEQRKSYIDEELVKAQIELDIQNERNHIHVPDQLCSTDGSEGLVVRRLLTDLI